MYHWGQRPIILFSNYDCGLTFSYFTPMSDFAFNQMSKCIYMSMKSQGRSLVFAKGRSEFRIKTVKDLREADCKHRDLDGNSKFCI